MYKYFVCTVSKRCCRLRQVPQVLDPRSGSGDAHYIQVGLPRVGPGLDADHTRVPGFDTFEHVDRFMNLCPFNRSIAI